MPIPSLPPIDQGIQTVVAIAENATAGSGSVGTLGVCLPVAYAGGEEELAGLNFGTYSRDYLILYKGRKDLQAAPDDTKTRVKIIHHPTHGVLRWYGAGDYAYVMQPQNHKRDKVVAVVEAYAATIKVVVNLVPAPGSGWESALMACPKGYEWEMSTKP